MFTKLGLIFLSFLLKLISSTYYPIFIILILGTITYLIAFFLEKKKDSKINYLFNNSVLIFFAIIIILNITGL